MSDTTSFRRTLRQMAEAEDAADRRRLFDMLASQIEVAFDNHANNTQVVLWDVQESAYKKIDALHEHQADTNLLLAGVAESLAMIQSSVQEVLAAHKEAARRQKKLEAAVKVLDERQASQYQESVADRAGIHREIADLKESITRIEAYLEPGMTPEIARERQAKYLAMIERHEDILRELASRGDR